MLEKYLLEKKMNEGTFVEELIRVCANAEEVSRTGLQGKVTGNVDLGVMGI